MYNHLVIQTFADASPPDVYQGIDSPAARRLPRTIWPVIRRKLDMVNAAPELRDLRAPPGNRLEALRGDRLGQYSIRVNDQYRVTFGFEDGDAFNVRCED
jgi:proteic killer suppression protein